MLTILLQAPNAGGGIMSFLPLILIVVIMYFFMIRPQVKKQKAEAKYRAEIQKGDKVVTIGGIHGKILEVNEDTLLIQAEGGTSKLKINKSAISKI
ncbi:MAG: preprotein translocase subunit YajC [Flavobacteriales bacterium]|nr:preprotein translocase subunit YajC [Flavobacteriales bacterium]